jgi:diguanylate cyclase (GGDEF)-like protein
MQRSSSDQPGNARTPSDSLERRPGLTLQAKATILVVGLTFVVTAATATYLLNASGELSRRLVEGHLVDVAALLARDAGGVIEAEGPGGLKRFAESAMDTGSILYVVVSNPEGKPLAGAHAPNCRLPDFLSAEGAIRSELTGTPGRHQALDGSGPFWSVTYPISRRTPGIGNERSASEVRLLGYLTVGMWAESLERGMAATMDVLTGVGVLAGAVAIPLGFLLVRRIISPIEQVSRAMLRFSGGDMDVRSPVDRHDEIGHLALSFNRMADEHQQAHDRLLLLNTELEQRVAARTRQLRELASREPLTGLYNRRHFNEVLQRALAEALRHGTDLSCIMIDLDDFKQANDALGHGAGDEILLITARNITSRLRSSDVAARYGGDEFVLLLPQTTADQALILAGQILEIVGTEIARRFPKAITRVSAGIASIRSLELSDGEDLVRAADSALYQAKLDGKNCIRIASGTDHPTALAVD